MKLIKKVLIVFTLLFTFLVQSQEEKVPSYFSNTVDLNLLQLTGSSHDDFQNKLQEKTSTISLKQIGDENKVTINDKNSYGEHSVYQKGNHNDYQFFNYKNNEVINLGIMQTGNSNLLKITGTNSLFRNLTITQFGGVKMSVVNY